MKAVVTKHSMSRNLWETGMSFTAQGVNRLTHGNSIFNPEVDQASLLTDWKIVSSVVLPIKMQPSPKHGATRRISVLGVRMVAGVNITTASARYPISDSASIRKLADWPFNTKPKTKET